MKLTGTISLLLIAVSFAFGQEPVRVGVGVIERKLSLAETLEMALGNNLDIEIERTSVATARQNLNAAKGAFDGVFRWQPTLESRSTPTSNVLFASNGKLVEHFHNQNFGYQQKLPWQGASVLAAFNNSRQSTNNPFAGLNPYTQSSFVLGFSLPLWRNRLIDRDRAELRIRSKAINVSEVDLELRVIDIVNRVELAYWDLVGAREGVTVAAEGVQWGQEQTARSKRMIDAGTLAPVELAGAEAELERRRDTYFASINTVADAENVLKTLIASSKADPIWNDAILPTDQKVFDAPATDDVQSAIDTAVKRRPELRSVTLRRESNDVQKGLAADQLKPQINLVANYTNAGLAGSVPSGAASNPFTQSSALQLQRINELSARAGLTPLPSTSFGSLPPSLLGGYGTVLSNLFGGNYPGIQVGLNMDWNTRNQTAKANVELAAINEKRLGLERLRTEQAIVAQVRSAMQAIETGRQRIQAAESSARAAKEKLDSETRLFQVGESTSFLVLTRQNEYTDSLRRVVVSKLELNRAVARYQQAAGMTLESHKLTVR